MACFVVYMLRVCLAVSIMAMVTSKKAGKNSTSECIKVEESSSNTSATDAPLPDVSIFGLFYSHVKYF